MAKQKSKILIVDDSEMNRAILSEILSDKYDIIEAENGVQAIAALNRSSAEISLMLLDIVMPEMDGFEVLAYMNRRRWIETVPVIMISSEKGGSYIQRAYDMGVSDYINRPYDAYVVLRRIENTIMLYAKQRRLANMVAEQLYEREKSNSMMVSILSHIVEFRNGESGMHVLHIHVMTELLLRRIKSKFEKYSSLTEEEIQLISMASSLHDIGKIGIPSKILNKPGRLTSEEFEIMKTHTTIGASMLSEMPDHENEPLVKTAYEICRWHHERYDGRGYPDGLKGDEIPISAQVVSLADVYDALTSERCYKKAFSHEKAIEMIKNGECGTFNPVLIECLLDAEKELQDELRVSSPRSQDKKSFNYILEMAAVDNGVIPTNLPAPVEDALSTARFFADHAEEIQFDYNAQESVVTVSEWGVKRLGLKNTVFNPKNQETNDINKRSVDNIAEMLYATTPENPDVTTEISLVVNGVPGRFKVTARSKWSRDEEPRYIGAMGIITEVTNTFVEKADGATGEIELNKLFDILRVVDAADCERCRASADGVCFDLWNRRQPCEDCIVRRAFENKDRFTKLEYIDSQIYSITAKYVENGGKPFVLEAAKHIDEYSRQIYGDALEHVYNRRYYNERVKNMNKADGVAIFDVDGFKLVNDQYGHYAGDDVLQSFTNAVFSCIRDDDLIVRFGGDEFIILFLSVSADEFRAMLENIRKTVAELVIEDYPDIRLTVSGGGIYNVLPVSDAVGQADELLYEAKKSGRNTVKIRIN